MSTSSIADPSDRAWAPTEQAGARASSPRRRRRDPTGWLLLAVAALLAALLAAWWWTSPRTRPDAPQAAAPAASAPGPRNLSPEQLQRTVAQMSERVKQAPADAPAWAMLAHSQAMQGEFEAARKSYARLAELLPRDAQVLADYADAVGMAQGRKLAGESAALIARALALDPKNLKALALAGREAFERRHYAEAVSFWERALAETRDAAVRAELDASIAEARAFDGRERPPEAQARKPGGTVISGRVTLSPELQARVSPDDTVFVFARPMKGSRMPVALLRRKVRDLPLAFTLDDSLAMVPELKLSMLAQVAVGARISRRGDAVPAPGDLQGLAEGVALGTHGLALQINEVVK